MTTQLCYAVKGTSLESFWIACLLYKMLKWGNVILTKLWVRSNYVFWFNTVGPFALLDFIVPCLSVEKIIRIKKVLHMLFPNCLMNYYHINCNLSRATQVTINTQVVNQVWKCEFYYCFHLHFILKVYCFTYWQLFVLNPTLLTEVK